MVQLTKSNHRNRSCSTGANHFPSARQHLCFPLCACRLYRLTPTLAAVRCRPRWVGLCFEIQQNPAALALKSYHELDFGSQVRLLCAYFDRGPREIAALIITSTAPALPPRLLMIADFAILCSSGRVGLVIRFLSIGPRIFSTPSSNPAWRRRPCASLTAPPSIRLDGGLAPPSYRSCSVHKQSPAQGGRLWGRPSADWADWPPRFA